LVGALFVLALVTDSRSSGRKDAGSDQADAAEGSSPRPSSWGQTEADGWTDADIEGLVDLGQIAEQRYRLSFDASEEGIKT